NILVGAIISVFISSFVIDALASNFGSEKNMARSVQLVAYSMTPAWVGGILNIVPALAIVGGLIGLYGFYLLYLGMPKLKKTPDDKLVGYYVVSLLVMLIVYMVIGYVISRVMMSAFGLSYGTPHMDINI
ncbi:MAG: Yip1 family protein, partial [Chitinophagaceae bacterium]